MIIKSLSRKSPSFAQLTAYMLGADRAQLAITHNLPASATAAERIILEFEKNHALLPRRANGNALYHEIMALPPEIGIPIREQALALRAIASRYLEQRAPQQLALGVIHVDTGHVHIHLMISSNATLSRRRLWLKKAEFAAIQRDLESYRNTRFPELGITRHYDSSSPGMKRSNREQAASVRSRAPSHKQELAATVASTMKEAKSREALDTALAEAGLALYQRGRSVGVRTEGGRRYRLSTLGLADEYAQAMVRIELAESRLASLQRGRVGRSREHDRES